MKEKLTFTIKTSDVDIRDILIDGYTPIASLEGKSGCINAEIAGDYCFVWKGVEYVYQSELPDDLIKIINDTPEEKIMTRLKLKEPAIVENDYFTLSLVDASGQYAELDGDPYIVRTKDGKIDFGSLKEDLIEIYKEEFGAKVEEEVDTKVEDGIIISPKEYIEQGGMTTSDKEDLVQQDKEKD